MKTDFLKNWTPAQFKNAEKQISKFLNSRFFELNKGHLSGLKYYNQYSNALGLAYTSSGDFAGLWICNVELYLDAKQVFKIEGFAQDAQGFVYCWCMDANENELYIPIN